MSARNSGRLRIIGGRHRGRKLPVPSQPGLRPTSDRVRETLFNWLAPVIAGSRCLDLFGGSGALGFEAASRGASEVVMVERSEPVARILEQNARILDAAQVRVHRTDALRWLSQAGQPFDLVFLDPPFDKALLGPSCDLLSRNGWLGSRSLVYLEMGANQEFPLLPAGWELLRDKHAGRVRYALVSVHDEGADTF